VGYTLTIMLSGIFIGILVALSAATWIYSKTMNRTGDNTQSALTAGAITGVFGFIVTVTIVAFIDSQLGN
jgi:cytochrome bd-type quinol oxidase subunit 2